MKTFCRKLLWWAGLLGVLAGAVWLPLLLYYRHEDERHARYAETCRLVNASSNCASVMSAEVGPATRRTWRAAECSGERTMADSLHIGGSPW